MVKQAARLLWIVFLVFAIPLASVGAMRLTFATTCRLGVMCQFAGGPNSED